MFVAKMTGYIEEYYALGVVENSKASVVKVSQYHVVEEHP